MISISFVTIGRNFLFHFEGTTLKNIRQLWCQKDLIITTGSHPTSSSGIVSARDFKSIGKKTILHHSITVSIQLYIGCIWQGIFLSVNKYYAFNFFLVIRSNQQVSPNFSGIVSAVGLVSFIMGFFK